MLFKMKSNKTTKEREINLKVWVSLSGEKEKKTIYVRIRLGLIPSNVIIKIKNEPQAS